MKKQTKLLPEQRASRVVRLRLSQAIYLKALSKAEPLGLGIGEWLRRYVEQQLSRSHHKSTLT